MVILILGLSVIKSVDFDIRENIKSIERSIKEAKLKNVVFLCFGETVLNGFNGLTWNFKEDIINNAISQDSTYMIELMTLARENKIAIGVGYYESYQNNIYDSYIVFDECGKKLTNYRRVSDTWKIPAVYGENYSDGKLFSSFKYMGKTFSIIICGDLWFDNYLEKIKNISCDYLIWPLYIDYSISDWESASKREYSDRVSIVGKDTFMINSWNKVQNQANGGAYYIKQDGKIEKEFPMLKEGVLKIEL